MPASLKKKALAAVTWGAADVVLRQGMSFGVSIILARLVAPGEFGTIALLYLFVGLVGVFIDGGFTSALIQRKDVTHTDESTVFWFNMAMGLAGAVAIAALGPWIADFYQVPILVPLAGIVGLNLFAGALGSIHGTLFTKRLDFKTPMKIGLVATGVSGAVGIGMAWQGFGVWALAMQTLTSTLLTTSLLWLFNTWRPRFEFSMASARSLFSFGGYMLASKLLDIVYSRIHTLLIGKLFGISKLGYYSRAESMKELPVGILSNILSSVAFPIFSAAAGDREMLQRGTRQAVRAMMLINVPVMFGIIATASALIETLMGPQWLPSVPVLQILCLAGVFWPLHVINLNVLMAQGHSNLFFRLEVTKKVVGVGFLAIGTFYGVAGIAWSQVAYGVLAFLINSHYTRLNLSYGPWRQVLDFLPVMGLSGLMMISVYSFGQIFDGPAPLVFLFQVMTGAVIFISGCHLFGVQAYYDAGSLISNRFPRLRLGRPR